MKNLTIGRTEYLVEAAAEAPDTYFLTGPRGGVLIAVPYLNNSEVFHAFRAGGTHSDLKVNGQVVRISRSDLEN